MSNQDQVSRERGNLLANGTVTELEELLKTAAQDIPLDETYLDALEAAILQRETECPTGRLSNPDKAWERFQKRYLSGNTNQHKIARDSNALKSVILTDGELRPHKPRRLRQTLLIAAVIVVMMVLLLPPVLGFRDIFQMVAQWTNEQFQFVTPTYENGDQNTMTPLMESLEEYGLPTSFAPTWFPEDRYFREVRYKEYENKKATFFAVFSDKNKEKLVYYKLVKHFQNTNPLESLVIWEKDKNEVTEFFYNGIVHYIVENNGFVGVHWNNDLYEVAVYGDISVDEVKKIVKSIYER